MRQLLHLINVLNAINFTRSFSSFFERGSKSILKKTLLNFVRPCMYIIYKLSNHPFSTNFNRHTILNVTKTPTGRGSSCKNVVGGVKNSYSWKEYLLKSELIDYMQNE